MRSSAASPAYLAWLNPAQTLVENIKQVMLAPGSLVLAEAMFLLQDEVREPRNYLAILQAIGGGAHSLAEIANASMIRHYSSLDLPRDFPGSAPGRAAPTRNSAAHTPASLWDGALSSERSPAISKKALACGSVSRAVRMSTDTASKPPIFDHAGRGLVASVPLLS